LWLSLFRTFEAVERVARQSMSDAGLGFSDFVLLEALLHLGPQTPTSLAEKSALTSGSITAALDRLAARGLVQRGTNPDDQRSRIVTLTTAGRGLIEPAYQAHAADIERLMQAALTTEQRAELFALLQLLRKTAQDELTPG
jgi:MarR family 2-MHQ and catechol resistance regulon transcriptional repressor